MSSLLKTTDLYLYIDTVVYIQLLFKKNKEKKKKKSCIMASSFTY